MYNGAKDSFPSGSLSLVGMGRIAKSHSRMVSPFQDGKAGPQAVDIIKWRFGRLVVIVVKVEDDEDGRRRRRKRQWCARKFAGTDVSCWVQVVERKAKDRHATSSMGHPSLDSSQTTGRRGPR